ncbi:MAG: hypothetical protein ACQERC_07265 [Bacteroidota bacterium]
MEEKKPNSFDLVKSDSLNLLTDSSDTIINVISESKLLDDIPFAGLITKTYKLGSSIKDYFLQQKLHKFLFEIKDIELKERQDFIYKLDKKDLSEIGSSVFILLDKYDSERKAQLCGKLLKKTIKEEIDPITFFRLSTILERLFIYDIDALNDFNQEKSFTVSPTIISLETLGLIEITGRKTRGTNSHTNYWDHFYRLSDLGELMKEKLEL